MRTDSSLLHLPVIFRTLISCDFGIFPVVKDWDLGYSSLLNFRVGKDDEKIIITFDFWSFKSLEEKADFLRVICTFSWAFDCTLINFVVVFGNRFSSNQEIEDFLVILYQFQLFLWLKYWKLLGALLQHLGQVERKTNSCKACNRFKLHLSCSLSEGKNSEI